MRARDLTTSIIPLAILAALCAPAARGDEPTMTPRARYHMRQHLDDLRTIERMLVDGKLAEAQTLAYFFTRATGMASRQASESRDIVLAASSLSTARTVDEALRHEVRIAAACAACHQREQRVPVFRAPSNAPPDRPTVAAQMARHQWAADRLWEGVIGASDEHWRVALDVIATTQLPPKVRPMPTQLGARLQRQARDALAAPHPTLSERATMYGELLVTCASCHAAQKPRVPPAARSSPSR